MQAGKTYVNIEGEIQSRGIIVFKKENSTLKFLLIKSRIGGHWTFPKGHWLRGETEKEAAIREVQEETGISDVEILDGFEAELHYKAFEEDKCVKLYLGETIENGFNPQDDEVEEVDWLSYKDTLEKITYNRTKEALTKAKEFLDKQKI